MKLYFNGIIYALSHSLDCIEGELLGTTTGHSKWVAYLCVCMGKRFGLTQSQLLDLAACAALHDNALTQYIQEEQLKGNIQLDVTGTVGNHCTEGEDNIKSFPFRTDVTGAILYHHENADGSGPFQKKEEETPFFAQLIHYADLLDQTYSIQDISHETYSKIIQFIKKETGTFFSKKIVDSFCEAFPEELYLSLKGKDIDKLLQKEIPEHEEEFSFEQIRDVIDCFGKIVDYKSVFTKNHSKQIADRAYYMAKQYNYDEQTCQRFYIAGALHDIGKMSVSNDVLEKPGKLTEKEFVYMQTHAWYTYIVLSQIRGFEDITKWATHHHEKLNGTGYPFGKKGEELDKTERLMACLDIYQALREDRPYKSGMTHEKSIEIMNSMVHNGFIDGDITRDIDREFSKAH